MALRSLLVDQVALLISSGLSPVCGGRESRRFRILTFFKKLGYVFSFEFSSLAV